MSQPKHTCLPWSVNSNGNIKADGETLLISGVSLPCGVHPDADEADANRDLIVKCVNEYDALKASNAELVKSLDWIFDQMDTGALVRDVSRDHEEGYAMRMIEFVRGLTAASEALKRAKGELK